MRETSSACDHSSRYGRGLPPVCCLRASWHRSTNSRNSAACASGLPVAGSITSPSLAQILPLHTAAGNGRPARPPARVRRLLAHGADPNLRDPRHHRTPLDECQPENRYPGSPAHDEVEAVLWPLTLYGDTQTSQPPGSHPRTQTPPPAAITPDPV